jgi:hypothetical protein
MAWNAIRVLCSEDEQYLVIVVPGTESGHVVALLAAGQPAAEDQVVNRGRVELRDLGQRGRDHLHGQIIGADAGQRSLERAPDRGTCGGDNDGLWHDGSLGLTR